MQHPQAPWKPGPPDGGRSSRAVLAHHVPHGSVLRQMEPRRPLAGGQALVAPCNGYYWTTSPRVDLDNSAWAKHTNTNETIDFLSSFRPLSLAVDAATMLEAFHNYGQERYFIGKEQDEGSKKQRAAFMLAKWFFDTGDRARLTVSTGKPP